jgi:hypothetical protein
LGFIGLGVSFIGLGFVGFIRLRRGFMNSGIILRVISTTCLGRRSVSL